MKFKAKSLLACAVLLSVMSVGTLAEAEWRYKVNDGAEQIWPATSDLISGGNKLEVWSSTGSDSTSQDILGGHDTGSVTIEGKTVIFNSGGGKYIYGAYTFSGSASNNEVIVKGGHVEGVYGGYSGGNGNANDNMVTINNGVSFTDNRYIVGGYSTGSGNAVKNTVIINGNVSNNYIRGGHSYSGNVTENTIIICSGNVSGTIHSGYSGSGEVSGNKIIVDGGNLEYADVYGYNNSANPHSNNILQVNNPVTIKKVAQFDIIDICNAGSVTIKDLTVESGCILKVDGAKIMDNAAITITNSANVASGAKLYVGSAVPNKNYKILEGSDGISVASWLTDEDMGDGFRAMYGLLVDTDNIINNANEFTIRFKIDPLALKNLDITNIFSNMPIGSTLQKFIENVSFACPNLSTQATVINTMANINSLANVQQGIQAVMAMATDALQTNIGTGSRAILGRRAEGVGRNSGVRCQGSGFRYQVSGFRKVSANDKDSAAIETVEQGKSDEVMPTMVENEEQKYDKTVWANYIHSKKTIDGLKTGHLTQNSTIQYNGVTVGADLWSNAKGFGGLALTTAEGKTNSSQNGASVKNDTDYHGVSLYQRYDYKDVAILFDLSYTHAKNDVTMSTAGTTDVTAKPKSDAYSAGVKVEYPVKIGHSSQLTPYTGVRYTHIHTDKYDNSLGISNDIKDQNLVNIPIGVQLKTEYTTNTDWKFGHIFEGGYVWNVGNRQSEQRLG